MPPEPLEAAPSWRRLPFRIFFPLGTLLAWAGVLHWLLYATELSPHYRGIFHAMTQVQGFLMCFAVGFLFTAIPRRTESWAPATWEMGLGLAAPIGTTVAAWMEKWAIAQLFWFALAIVLVQFAVRRFSSRGAGRRPPTAFVWIPIAILLGFTGSLMTGLGAALGTKYWHMHLIGTRIVLEGMFIGLVIGAGSLVVPVVTRGDSAPDWPAGWRGRRDVALHLAGAAILAASFWIEIAPIRAEVAERLAYGLRGAVALVALLAVGRIWRWPSIAGFHRWLVWLGAWLVPAGFLLVAAFPFARKSLLHVSFVGGFALLAFSVGAHVVAAHCARPDLLFARPRRLIAFGVLLLAAAGMRTLVELDGERFTLWIGASAGAFLAATILWGSFVGPLLAGGGTSED